MRLVIVPIDKFISIDGVNLLDVQQDLSWIPSNIHAVQWYGDHGEIEYNDGTFNEQITDLGIFSQAIQTHAEEIKRIEDEKQKHEEEIEAKRDYWTELRGMRNSLLSQTDWTQLPDIALTEDKKTAYATYRQELRDLPSKVTDPKPFVNDFDNAGWPKPNV